MLSWKIVENSHIPILSKVTTDLRVIKNRTLFTDTYFTEIPTTDFFFNCDSLHATLNSHTRHGVTRKKSTKRLQLIENLFRKNLQLKDVC